MAHIQTQDEWEEEMSRKILAYIRNEIYLDLRFLDIALSALIPKADARLHAFATDGQYLYFSAEQLLRVFQSNARYLNRAYLHTVLHCIFSHLWIGGSREPFLWNLACDIAVEYTIDGMDKPCTKRILSWNRGTLYARLKEEGKGASAAVIYRLLCEKEEEEIRLLEKEFYVDDHCYWPKHEDERAQREGAAKNQQKWDKIARQAKLNQNMRGDDPKDGEELLLQQLEAGKKRRSYREFLRKFAVLREELHADPDEFDLNYYTYGLRRYGNMPLLEPLESREVKKIREFVIVLDTSYSTSGELIGSFLQETADILRQSDSFFSDSKIRILQCDDAVRREVLIAGEKELRAFLDSFELIGGGSTDFRPAFSYVNTLLEQGACSNLSGLLYFTDGKGIYPQKKPDYPTAFLFLEDYDEEAVPAWAMRLRLWAEDFVREPFA
ncbi:MAG: VWA-like domain-containing protein [Clostridiales bacterium]|nr:VWA-like domain-containing protein [Clostridiales bacterium]